MKNSMIAALLLAAACTREGPAENEQANAALAAPAAPAAENAVAVPVEPALDPTSPEAANAVLKEYFRLVGERKFVEAHRLWTGDSELSDGAFAGSFDPYRDYHGSITGSGRMEGAAGSSYIDLPVEVTGRLKSGDRFKQTGTVTLRRVNDVPGATPEQLQWRIYKTDLKPRSVATDFRFAGRWATDQGNCRSQGWMLTASSLKTPTGTACSFSKVTEVPGGYDIAASCMTSGPARDDRLRLRYAESARALLVDSGTLGDTGLVRCR